jgi:hypothetical protein
MLPTRKSLVSLAAMLALAGTSLAEFLPRPLLGSRFWR